MLRKLMVLLALVLTPAVPLAAATPTTALPDSVGISGLHTQLQHLTPMQLDEVLWLARCMYSESDRSHEQRLVGWVVRNRVETGFGGRTYRDVVLRYKQFSAFNAPTPRRARILSYDQHTRQTAWLRTLQIALDVYQAPPAQRPFPVTTRHFYSPVSMPNNAVPYWATDVQPLVSADLGVDAHRFQFFDSIDMALTVEAEPPSSVPMASAATPTVDQQTAASSTPTYAPSARRRLKLSGRVARPTRPTVQRPTGSQ